MDIFDDFILDDQMRHLCCLMVALAGFVFALIFWRRTPRACGLMLAATSAQMVPILVGYGAQVLLAAHDERGWEFFAAAAHVLPWLQVIGMALIIAAVLVGRGDPAAAERRPLRPSPDDDWARPAPAPKTDTTGIQARNR